MEPVPAQSLTSEVWFTELEDWQRPRACMACGAAVVDTDAHAKWHSELDARDA